MFSTWFTLFIILAVSQAREPECVSRFDTDYKIVTKLVELERQVEVLKQESELQKAKLDNILAEKRGTLLMLFLT